MAKATPVVVFFHGLNTYGDDRVHVGPFTFGGMGDRWRAALTERGIKFVAIEGLGFDAPESQARRALEFLKKKKLVGPDQPLHLLGHSIGGLSARAFAKLYPFQGNIASILTFGTPHHGAMVAEQGLELHKKAPVMHSLFRSFGYDATARTKSFRHFTRDAIVKFNAETPAPLGVKCISFVCSVKPNELSLPLRAIYRKLHPEGERESDGFIHCDTQKWEEYRGTYELDHFAELGVYLHLQPRHRRQSRLEFERLADDIAEIVRLAEPVKTTIKPAARSGLKTKKNKPKKRR